jgi:hypothetical protein
MPPDVKVSASPSAGYPSGPANIQKKPRISGVFSLWLQKVYQLPDRNGAFPEIVPWQALPMMNATKGQSEISLTATPLQLEEQVPANEGVEAVSFNPNI